MATETQNRRKETDDPLRKVIKIMFVFMIYVFHRNVKFLKLQTSFKQTDIYGSFFQINVKSP